MILLIDEREMVVDSYKTQLKREGYASVGFSSTEFQEWADTSYGSAFESVGACLIGAVDGKACSPKYIRQKTNAPIIALVDLYTLENTLSLLENGYDDVLRKPVHVREILARISAIKRRNIDSDKSRKFNRLRVFCDGRDPEIDGEAFVLPRRERRILEFLASVNGRRVTKAQIFDSIYGAFDDDVDENVIESHISKLRKKLRARLGFELVDSKRFLGYRLSVDDINCNVCA